MGHPPRTHDECMNECARRSFAGDGDDDDALESFCALIGGDGDDDDALESFCALIGGDGDGADDVLESY